MKTPGRLASRIAVGTAIYLAIIALAAPLPPAAGLMLTFPALNGLAFYFSEDRRAAAIARTMLWMPIINGALCAAYVVLFLLFAKSLSPTALGWGLLLIEAALWYAWVSRSHVRRGIDPTLQLSFAIAATIIGVALAAATMLLVAHLGVSPPRAAPDFTSADLGRMVDAVARGRLKIALFALTLAVLVSAIEYVPISDTTRGILAGLPIVPFGGLVAIAGDASLSANARIAIFLGMIGGVWLGPPIAVWYIFCLSRYLGGRKKINPQAADSLSRFGALLVAWLVALVAIIAAAYVLSTFAAPMTTPQHPE